jgi:hypothetical protein
MWRIVPDVSAMQPLATARTRSAPRQRFGICSLAFSGAGAIYEHIGGNNLTA